MKRQFQTMNRNKPSEINDKLQNCRLAELKLPHLKICKHSLKGNIFLENLSVAKVTSIFKSGDPTEVGNFRPIFPPPPYSITCNAHFLKNVNTLT